MSTKVLCMLTLIFALQLIVFFAASPKTLRVNLKR